MVETFVSRAVSVLSTGTRVLAPVAFVERVGFWIAAAFPLVYATLALYEPPLVATHVALAGAIGLNFVALVVGHGHDPSRRVG